MSFRMFIGQISYVSPIILFFKNEILGDLQDKIRAIKNVSLNSCMGFFKR